MHNTALKHRLNKIGPWKNIAWLMSLGIWCNWHESMDLSCLVYQWFRLVPKAHISLKWFLARCNCTGVPAVATRVKMAH